jgi:hypothetical protein
MICEDSLNRNLTTIIEVGCWSRKSGAYRGGVMIAREAVSMMQDNTI